MGSTIAPPEPFSFAHPLPPTAPQHMLALELANRTKLARTAFKRRLADQPDCKSATRMCSELIAEPPEVLGSMQIGKLLRACRRIGTYRADKTLLAARVAEHRPLRALTPAERQRLIGALGMWG